MRIAFFADGTRLDDLIQILPDRSVAAQVPLTLAQHDLLNHETVDFVGFVYLPRVDVLLVFLPKTLAPDARSTPMDFTEQPSLRLAAISRLTLQVLLKYNRERRREAGVGRSARELDKGHKRFALALALIEDWKLKGALTASSVQLGKFSGRPINWPQTIKRTHPFIERGVPIYVEAIAKRTTTDTAALLPQIQRQCVLSSLHICGWLDPNESAVRSDVLTNMSLPQTQDHSIWLKSLYRCLDDEFSDERLTTIRLLISFMEGAYDSGGPLVCGTNAFHAIWQTMCGLALGDEYRERFEPFMPQPRFITQTGESLEGRPYSLIRQIPDIVYSEPENRHLVVADAKYYDCRFSIPGWPDIGKQLLYTRSINTIRPELDIESAFIFPWTRVDPMPRFIRLTATDGRNIGGLPTIRCVYWDGEAVMEEYLQHHTAGQRRFRASISRGLDIIPRTLLSPTG